MNMTFYVNEITAKKKIITQVITLIENSNNTENILLAIKAIEALENVDLYPEFHLATETIVNKILNMDLTNSIGQDLTLLSRALKLKDIPTGREDRWYQLTQDEKNININGEIVIGERTLESFDDKILETFYNLN